MIRAVVNEWPEMQEPPAGAILTKREADGAEHLFKVDRAGQISETTCEEACRGSWFGTVADRHSGRIGWGFLFDNYFHALAYSLKVKQKLKEKDHV